jgi:hypothetical protein
MNATAKIMRRAHAALFYGLIAMAIYLELTNGWPK